MNLRLTFLEVGCLCMLGFSLACSKTPAPRPPDAKAVQEALGATAGDRPVRPVESPELRIYLDVSESMRGFVSRPDSAYVGSISGLLERSAISGLPIEAFQFAGGVSHLQSTAPRSLLSPTLYSGTSTSFPALFREIARRWQDGAVSVVVSDLVQSTEARDQRDLVVAFKELAKLNPEVLLLGVRSSFQGRYFVEGHLAGTRLHLDLPGSGKDQGRPFYFLVIAPSHAALEKVERLLLHEVVSEARFDSSTPGLAVEGMRYVPEDSAETEGWGVKSKPTELPSSKGPRSLFQFEDSFGANPDKGPLRIRLQVAEGDADNAVSRLMDPEVLDVEATTRTFANGKWSDPVEVAVEKKSLFATEKKRTVVDLRYSFRRPKPGTWDAYRLRVFTGAGNTRLPPWVADWSAPDDSVPSWGNRTLKLDLFVESLFRNFRERIPICEQYVVLGRGEK